ncbi:DUF4149 domain-containing protein [Rhodoferax sp.]|uniref:DUF4149 domain-containing protein n=1 Tax=Rhodoferax sp. TaxID=50421 RepID=UPI00273044FC|nr:DUF4149 domain-containing protein [Rhodoferax sp.]MDP2441706.1 DUF4149 domain-containing protein [Rhodoferax sp.]MDZ4207489.1 DUF4149 domain-containing protein [Rhodoferax sp.]
MTTRLQALAPWLAALWWGSLTTLGVVIVPLLFVHLPSPALAGGMAAKLFTAQTWLGTGCCLLLLLLNRPGQDRVDAGRAQSITVFVMLGVLLALLSEFAVAPRIVSRENLRLWHSVGSAMFALQWLCAGVTFWKVTRKVGSI